MAQPDTTLADARTQLAEDALTGISEVTTDGTRTQTEPLLDRVRALRMLEQDAAGKKGKGFRISKFSPPGTA